MMEEVDWDLQAVVRGFTTTTTCELNTDPQPLCFSSSSSSSFVGTVEESDQGLFSSGIGEGLEDLCKPFCPNLHSLDPPISSTTCSASGFLVGFMEQQQQQQLNQSQIIFGAGAAATSLISASTVGAPQTHKTITASFASATAPQTQRAKKRKNLMKKVCHVPAEGLSSDMGAWRKYGQKPIKGSPYPRGYYRCSSSKGCLARKQVERNRSDPKMFIVTYTAEHNHPTPTQRSMVAGITRHKTITDQAQDGTLDESTNTTTTPPAQAQYSPTTSLSPATDSKTEYEDLIKDDDDDDDDNEMGPTDMILNYDFFMDFEDLHGYGVDIDPSPDQSPASIEFPWLAKGSSTATAPATAAEVVDFHWVPMVEG
ncbi:WRKY Transcription Factor [Dionaea muscipula]